MAVGRISGPLLKANLLRDGVDLAFETDLLYLDVINGRVGIKTATPDNTLTINGTTRTTNLEVTTQADIASFTISTNTIASSDSVINLTPSGVNPVVYQGKLQINGNLQLSTNAIQTIVADTNLELRTSGTGQVNVNSNMLVTGNLHATGNITADGNITIGDANTDNVTFNADIASNIVPDVTNTYALGTDPTAGGKAWSAVYATDVIATTVTTANILVNGINLALPVGHTIFVATTGSDSNAGVHENNPVLTLKHALAQAVSGDTVYVYAGTYSEIFPLTIPVGVTVKGSNLRSVIIQPTIGTIDNDAFLLNGETTIEDLTIGGFTYNSTNNTGYGFRFATNFTVTTRSPYVRNVTVITRGSVVTALDPYGFDQNDAGKGMFLDGSVANASSKEASCLFHSVTFITPNQETISATNGVRIEWLNSFTYFADKGIYVYSSSAGFAGAGLTRLRLGTRVGTWAVGNTVTYYATDGTTVLGSGTIASTSGDYVNLTGRHLGFATSASAQDIRTSAGGTASSILFADYSDFGVELRSIGSANIYGTYGAYGDGAGVIVYLISQNFAYIGAGKLSSNDPTSRIAANEVVKLNGAQIYYTSVDNEGNFKVGDNFFINQKTGEVLFNNQSLVIEAVAGVTFTDGTHSTIITSTDITTGNMRLVGNSVQSTTGDINVTASSGTINLQNNTYVTGNLDVTGNVTIGGNITIGDATTDTINFVAGINSNLVPATTALYDLGTSSLRWNTAFLSRVEIDSLVIDSNTISTTAGNDDLQLIANGTGRIYVPTSNVQLDQSLTVTQNLTVTTGSTNLKNVGVTGTVTQTGNITQTGDFTSSGNTLVTGNITGTGYLQLPVIQVAGNVVSTTTTNTDLELQANGTGNVVIEGIKVSDNNIQSTVTNSNITLTPQGTGNVIINNNQSIQIPVGTTAQRPATPTAGMIRYNTDLLRYEGYDSGYWLKLGGVTDNSGNTRILAEATPGANDNTLYFYAGGNLTATIDSTKLFAQKFQTSQLDINGNTISAISTNGDINLTTTGTGGVKIGNLRIYNNTITNTLSGAITEFLETGTGFVRIAGTNGVVIPSGNSLTDRPLVPETGMMRFNTDGQLVEVFNGVSWASVAGASGGVTSVEATNLGIAATLIFG